MTLKRKLKTTAVLVGVKHDGTVVIIKTASRHELAGALEKEMKNTAEYSHVVIARGLNVITNPIATVKPKRAKKKTAAEKKAELEGEETEGEETETEGENENETEGENEEGENENE